MGVYAGAHQRQVQELPVGCRQRPQEGEAGHPKAKQAIKDFVYKLRLIDWSSMISFGIPEETMGIITILMSPGSTRPRAQPTGAAAGPMMVTWWRKSWSSTPRSPTPPSFSGPSRRRSRPTSRLSRPTNQPAGQSVLCSQPVSQYSVVSQGNATPRLALPPAPPPTPFQACERQARGNATPQKCMQTQ